MKNLRKVFDVIFWKFIIVGIANTVFGTCIMFLFYNFFHLGYWLSSASNYFFGSILSYFLNKYFTFNNCENTIKTLPRFVLNISVCYLFAYGVAKPIVKYCLSGFQTNLQENVAMLVGMCFFVGVNYVGQRFFVFKSRKIENE